MKACPNCDSQLDTFGSKNGANTERKIKRSVVNPEWRKQPRLSMQKYTRPNREQLVELLIEYPTSVVAKKLGLKSDNTLRKWCKSLDIDYKAIRRNAKIKTGRKTLPTVVPPHA